MSDKLRCEIVQDLLPSYVDGLTSDETNEAVKDHLRTVFHAGICMSE